VMVGEHRPVEVVGELVRVEIRAELAFLDSGPGGVGEDVEPVSLGLHDEVAGGPGPVVKLHRGGDERAATRQRRRSLPGQPRLEQRAHPRLAAGRCEAGLDHLLDESRARRLQHLDEQLLFRSEMGEQPALRELQVLGEAPDRKPLEPLLGRDLEGMVEDGPPGLSAFRHRRRIVRPFDASQGPSDGRLVVAAPGSAPNS